MRVGKTEQQVSELAQPITERYGCYVYDVEFKCEGGNWFLRLFIDKDGGVSLDDCELVSKALSDKLDELDLIEPAYFLEVSSPGLDRKLTRPWHFETSIGKLVDVKLYKRLNGMRQLTGLLTHYQDGVLSLEVEGETISLTQKEIARVNLHVTD